VQRPAGQSRLPIRTLAHAAAELLKLSDLGRTSLVVSVTLVADQEQGCESDVARGLSSAWGLTAARP
jgi:hypothetical protein